MPNEEVGREKIKNEVKKIVNVSNRVTAFERTIHKSEAWISEMHQEMDWASADEVYHLLRAVLHAIRDQLNTNEVAHFASQLPLLLRGTFYECWNPKVKNIRAPDKQEFLNTIRKNFDPLVRAHFDLEAGVTLTLRVIFNHIDAGEMYDVIQASTPSLREFYEHVQHMYIGKH